MIHLAETANRLERNRSAILDELHAELRPLVLALLVSLGSRFAPYCGYRGPDEQARALADGASNARFGESPHNFHPALACDVVLHPIFVQVRPHPKDPTYPDLWDDTSPEAVRAWADLETAAAAHGLERVDLAPGKRDRPHLQLFNWRARLTSTTEKST